jgi:predicted RNase H-like nuclease (RuvC/YqgF family)
MDTLNIPEDYRELSERKAAELAGVSRSTFRRRHLEGDALKTVSQKTRQDGSKFIPFEEVYRLYGATVLENLRKTSEEPKNQMNHTFTIGSEPIDTTQESSQNQVINHYKNGVLSVRLHEYMDLKTELASKEAELAALKKRIEDQKRQLEESKEREFYERERVARFLDELQFSRRLLEDKNKQAQPPKTSALSLLWPGNWFKPNNSV